MNIETPEPMRLVRDPIAVFGTSDFLEFDSMINLRPSRGNRSRSVDDAATRQAIAEIVARLVQAGA